MTSRSRWLINFSEKVAEEIEKTATNLVGGGAVDHTAYREQVGYIRGLSEAHRIAEEVDTLILGG